MTLNVANCMFQKTHIVCIYIYIQCDYNTEYCKLYISNNQRYIKQEKNEYSLTTNHIKYKHLHIPVLRRQRLDHSFGLSGASRYAVCHHSGESIGNCHVWELALPFLKNRILTETPSIRWIALISWTVVKTSKKHAEALGLTANLMNRLSTHERVKW